MTIKQNLEVGGKTVYHDAVEKLHEAKLTALRKRLAGALTTGEKLAWQKRIAAEIQDHKRKVAEIRGIHF